MPRRLAAMHDPPRGDCHDIVERLAAGVAAQRLDVDAFMEMNVDEPVRRLDGVAHETVLSALPREGDFAFEVATHILVEGLAPPAKQRVVGGWKQQPRHLREDNRRREEGEDGGADEGEATAPTSAQGTGGVRAEKHRA